MKIISRLLISGFYANSYNDIIKKIFNRNYEGRLRANLLIIVMEYEFFYKRFTLPFLKDPNNFLNLISSVIKYAKPGPCLKNERIIFHS